MNILNTGILNYLSGDMIKDKRIPCTIVRVTMEEMPGGKKKPVIYLEDRTLGIVLNTTNTRRLVAAYGTETDDWIGQPVTVYAEQGVWFGKEGWAIRLFVPESPSPSAGSNGQVKESAAANGNYRSGASADYSIEDANRDFFS